MKATQVIQNGEVYTCTCTTYSVPCKCNWQRLWSVTRCHSSFHAQNHNTAQGKGWPTTDRIHWLLHVPRKNGQNVPASHKAKWMQISTPVLPFCHAHMHTYTQEVMCRCLHWKIHTYLLCTTEICDRAWENRPLVMISGFEILVPRWSALFTLFNGEVRFATAYTVLE